ncbi:MAG: sigma 54-interacting transcriptional regulator [Desulfobacteraceae bacterium]|nr:sigma 54-interacting transcriptional regulator [Desulfobacteraceae bacterium]
MSTPIAPLCQEDYGRLAAFILQSERFSQATALFAIALGVEQPDLMHGLSLWDWVHPDDHPLVRAELSGSEALSNVHPPVFRLLTQNKETLWAVLSRQPLAGCDPPDRWGCLIDATPFARITAELQESLTRYESILDDADIHLGEIDLEGRMTFINDAGCRLWGLPRRKLIGLHSDAYLFPETRDKVTQIYRQVFHSGVPIKNAVIEVIGKAGSRRTIETSVSLIRNPPGVVTGFRNVTRDITERTEAEKNLAAHRSRLQAIFRSVEDAIITVDPEMKVIEANHATETICGVGIQELVGRPFEQSQAVCSRSCREVLQKTIDSQTAFKEHRIECDHRERLQQVANISSAPLLDPQGHFMGAVMVIRDITRQRDMERELRERNQFQNLIGRNKTMQDIYRLLEDLASLDTTVLVTGESGTGKELVAKALHYSGKRAFKPFVTVNCAALSEGLLESELFGHVKGAFTGAIRDKQGRFQAAHGGTLMLDEIGDMPPMIQIKLLRVLQEKEFERVGDTTPIKVDVRVIACTNKNLKEKVRRGEFRQDLYYRLKVVEVAMPPLRNRLEDLPLLVDHFRRAFNERFKKNIEGISIEVLDLFMEYSWPGNVRELEHVMEHAFVVCHGGTITLKHLPADMRNFEGGASRAPSLFRNPGVTDAEEITQALKQTGGNKTKAARLLGISRRTIYRKIDAFGVHFEI